MVDPASPPVELPRYLQLLWDREPAGRRGPKPGRTIQEVGAAGVAVADRNGLEGVSMKSVAAELGLTPMSLYRYVDSKEQLLEVMLDVAYGPPDRSLVASGPWRERLSRWAYALVDALLQHPWISMVPMAGPPLSPNILGWTDAGAQAYEGAELTAQQKMSSLLVVDGYVRSHVRMSLTMGFAEPDPQEPNLYATYLPTLLDPDRFPALLATSPAILDDDPEGDFFRDELRFGLDLILDGIESLTRQGRRQPASSTPPGMSPSGS
ncbi:MAG: TetR/AcrR family transcriptional regulator [Lapillicoccus sp.]